jgi:hypothetical protein
MLRPSASDRRPSASGLRPTECYKKSDVAGIRKQIRPWKADRKAVEGQPEKADSRRPQRHLPSYGRPAPITPARRDGVQPLHQYDRIGPSWFPSPPVLRTLPRCCRRQFPAPIAGQERTDVISFIYVTIWRNCTFSLCFSWRRPLSYFANI